MTTTKLPYETPTVHTARRTDAELLRAMNRLLLHCHAVSAIVDGVVVGIDVDDAGKLVDELVLVACLLRAP